MIADQEPLTEPGPTLLDANQRFSQSLIWQLQRNYFNQQGVQAWNTGTVPHYVTSNPFIANAYSKVIFGFLRDCSQNQQTPLDPTQPIYIVELGSGSGRFAYHFLKQFFETYLWSTLRHIPVTYVMTDLAQQNLDFWQAHPFLRPFIEQGVLDFAQFDIEQDQTLTLMNRGETLSAETLKNPLIAIANYFFDSLPHDIFHIQGEELYETQVTLTTSNANPNNTDSSPDNPIDNPISIAYNDVATVAEGYYADPAMNQVLQDYQTQLSNTSLLFPNVGLQGLNILRQISRDRLLFLSADKGHTNLTDLAGRSNPKPTVHGAFSHGAFSVTVNYHAIARYSEIQGGQALMPDHLRRSIAICGFLFGTSSHDHIETYQAYQAAILHASPDDFFALKKAIEPHFDTLTLKQILAYLRFSRWDHKIFLGCFDNLMEQVETASDSLCDEIYQAIHNIWQTYYFIGEEKDLPFHCAMLLYKMRYYTEAINYLDCSLEFYGDHPGVLYNQAVCYLHLKSPEQSLASLDRALNVDPQFEAAQALKGKVEKQSKIQN
ncbi:MAG: SAM-dependent methyltransferase [Cyanobacteria bacterium P01_A01_bin.123]